MDGKMGYEDFVYFILSEEDKSNNISLDYWFKCIDLDCDGCLRANEMLVCDLTVCSMTRDLPVKPDLQRVLEGHVTCISLLVAISSPGQNVADVFRWFSPASVRRGQPSCWPGVEGTMLPAP
jgi:hypothetical protein